MSAGFERRVLVLGGFELRISSYPVGARFSARADNISPGTNIGRGMGDTRDAAEVACLTVAAQRLGLSLSELDLRRVLETAA